MEINFIKEGKYIDSKELRVSDTIYLSITNRHCIVCEFGTCKYICDLGTGELFILDVLHKAVRTTVKATINEA